MTSKTEALALFLLAWTALNVVRGQLIYQSSMISGGQEGNRTLGSSYQCVYNNGTITVNGVTREATEEEKAEMEKYMADHGKQMMSGFQKMWEKMRSQMSHLFDGFWNSAAAAAAANKSTADNDTNKLEERSGGGGESKGNDHGKGELVNGDDEDVWKWLPTASNMLELPSFCKDAAAAAQTRPAEQPNEMEKKNREAGATDV